MTDQDPTSQDPIEAAFADAQPEPDCPVTVLGNNAGIIYVLQTDGQIRAIANRDLSKLQISGIFAGDVDWLWKRFPRTDKDGFPVGWDAGRAAEYLQGEAFAAGVVSPGDVIRGAGAWPAGSADPFNGLVIHAGDAVLVGGEWRKPGRYGAHIYPAMGPAPRPSAKPLTSKQALTLLSLLGKWAFRDPASPRLLLGWIAAGVVPGALDWRPHIWLSGDRQTGKTTLMDFVRSVLGSSLLHLADATEAGIRQALGPSARPVAIDEIEAEAINDRALSIVKLARLASSRIGGRVARGSSEGVASIVGLDTIFLFSSINRPPLSPQDLQRITVLDMQKLPGGAEDRNAVKKAVRDMAGIGPALRGRVISEWDRFADILELFHDALTDRGHGTRAADQIGTLLALSELLISDGIPDAVDIQITAEMFDPEEMAALADDASDHDRCLDHLLTSTLPTIRRNEARVVSSYLATVIKTNDMDDHNALRGCGITVTEIGGRRFLAVSNSHQQLAQIYAGTHWAARSGSSGGWMQALRRIEGATAHKDPVRFGSIKQRATLIAVERLQVQTGAYEGADIETVPSVPATVPPHDDENIDF